MNLFNSYRELFAQPHQRHALIAVSMAYLLVQVASFPIALSIPSISEYFDVSLASASWVVVAELLALGSTVFLAARLGDRYGHNRIFFAGAVIATISGGLAAFSENLPQLVVLRGVQGIGAALITGNAHAILAGAFPVDQRAKAFAVPTISARVGAVLGLITFALFLQFLSWRLMFYTFIPLGLLAIWSGIPLLKEARDRLQRSQVPMDFIGGILFIGTIATLILSGMHLHEGAESFTSSEALRYHLPMNLLFVALLGLFFVVQSRIREPFMDFSVFKIRPFSMALFSNTTYHMSMLAVLTLMPIVVERGFGLDPIFVLYVLVPDELIGVFIPILSGWYYDKYRPTLLRPIAMSLIALGIILMGVFALRVSFWVIPALLLPATIGASMFQNVNNAVIMNAVLPEHRGFASGMIETTRQVGHTLGATIAASAIGLVLPVTIDLLSPGEAQGYYVKGLQVSALVVTGIIVVGAFLTYYDRSTPVLAPMYQPESGGSDGGS